MDFNYDIEFGQDHKTLTFKTSLAGYIIVGLFALIMIGMTLHAVRVSMNLWFTLPLGLLGVVFTLAFISVLFNKRQLILEKDVITVATKDLFRGVKKQSLPCTELVSVFKRVETRKGKYGTKQEIYYLSVEMPEGQTIDLSPATFDIRRIDEVKKVVANYTGLAKTYARYS